MINNLVDSKLDQAVSDLCAENRIISIEENILPSGNQIIEDSNSDSDDDLMNP